jgi:hypothetical protein
MPKKSAVGSISAIVAVVVFISVAPSSSVHVQTDGISAVLCIDMRWTLYA